MTVAKTHTKFHKAYENILSRANKRGLMQDPSIDTVAAKLKRVRMLARAARWLDNSISSKAESNKKWNTERREKQVFLLAHVKEMLIEELL